jgi:hypothetical protein
MRKALLIGLLSVLGIQAYAQRNCGTMPYYQKQLSQDPTLGLRRQQIEREIAQWQDEDKNTLHRGNVVITIPVVVHVVYANATQNISDAQIQSQINVLNADYRRLNSDTNSVPSVFRALGADCQINFCLAKRDPNGNATTGIVRKSTTASSFIDDDKVKSSTTGGDNAWNTTKYLNLWVCNLGGGLLGYAQFPGGAQATDGVVINYTAFGTSGTAASPYNKGRTATHEIGHWLNLYHVWGDANCGNDQVSDTPTQQTSNYGCPTFPHVTCSNGPNGDMFMNYMDYVDDACMMMFSLGQSSRMAAAINTSRPGLLTSDGCTPPSTTTTCAVPTGLSAGTITASAATISWTAVSGATAYTLNYKTSAASAYTSVNVSGTSYSLSGLTASTTYSYQVSASCGTNSTSAFTTATTFTTLAATSTGCADAFEPNNSLSAAKSIAVNTSISGLISSATDVDYFKFTTSSTAKNIKVTLTALPADFDIKLYSPTGAVVGSSVNAGTSDESITYNNGAVGTYTVYIYGYSGVFNATKCYTLKAQTASSSFRFDPYVMSKKESEFPITLYPNPTQDVLNVLFSSRSENMVEAVLIDLSGKVLARKELSSTVGVNKFEFETSGLTPGLYLMQVRSEEGVQTEKFFKQ